MSEFVYLFRGGDASGSPAQRQEQMQKWVAWMKDLGERGHLKDRGNALRSTGCVVKSKKPVTDGPYSEKDLVVGYLMVEARDLEEAATLSSGCPILGTGGAVEVRPVMKLDM